MGEGDDYPCPDCGQYIFKSTYRYNRKGWALKLNCNDGDGGKHGDPHRCPKRKARIDKEFKDMRKCEQCHALYNLDTYPLCPTCFKLVCEGCECTWTATRFNVAEKHGLYHLVRRCPDCGLANPRLVFDEAACTKMRAVVAINNSKDRT